MNPTTFHRESPTDHRAIGWISILTLAIAAAGGCTVGPEYHPPGSPMTLGAWIDPAPSPQTGVSVVTHNALEVKAWWTTFNDAALDALVAEAVDANLDLKQAESRIRQARAARGVVASALWPSVDTSAAIAISGGGQGTHNLFRAGLDAAWELDVFGGVRRDIEASEADIDASVADLQDVYVTLAAEVALNYIDLRGTQEQIAIARKNLDAQRHSAELTRKRFDAGFVGALDVANANALVASTRSQIPLLESAARQTMYNLGVLLDREPGALLERLATAAAIPTNPPQVPIGLPADLLKRRPDIRRAEANLHAATARIGVAESDLFPRFSLTGSLGLEANKLASLANWSSHFWTLGPTVSWPLFDAGRIRANIAVKNELHEQALLAYRKSVLIALQDVESALIAYSKEQEHRAAIDEAVVANRKAVDLATKLYTQGQTTFLSVLDAQRSLFASEDAQVQTNRIVATNLVALYKSLGGGWPDKSDLSKPQ